MLFLRIVNIQTSSVPACKSVRKSLLQKYFGNIHFQLYGVREKLIKNLKTKKIYIKKNTERKNVKPNQQSARKCTGAVIECKDSKQV